MLLLYHLKSLSSLLQADTQPNPIISQPEEQIGDPRARILEVQALLRLLLKLGKHLPYNIYLEGLSGKMPKHRLSSQTNRRLEHAKLHNHLGIAGGSKPHSLVQGASQWGVDYSQAQFRAPDLQKNNLLDQACTLPLSPFPMLVGVGCPIHQVWEFHLSHVLGLARNYELTLEKHDLPSHLINFPVSRSQQGGTLPGLPLSPGGPRLHLNGGRPHPGHLFLKLHCISSVLVWNDKLTN
jgi:hypothetical protein